VSPHRIASAAAVLLCASAGLLGSVASAQTPSPSPSAGSPSSPATSVAPSASAPAEQGLALLVSAEPATVVLGDRTMLVAQVTNTGSGETAATSLTVTLPPELELESSFPPATSGVGRTYTFELGALDPGASVVVQLTATGAAVVDEAVVAAAAAAGGATAHASTAVSVTDGAAPEGLAVSSRTRGVLTQVGSMLRYEVVVSNDGEADLENVLVVDVAPAEVQVVSVDIVDEVEAVQIGQSGGRHDIVWNVGSLPAGASVELPWDGRVARPGDLRAVNSVRGLLGTTEATRGRSESFLAAEGPRELANPPFEPIEDRVVTFVAPPPGEAAPRSATQPGAVLPFTGAAPWQIVRAGALLVLGGLLLVLGTRLSREPRKALIAALLAGLVGVACVSANEESGDAAGPVTSPRTAVTDDPRDEEETRVKGERIVRGEGDAGAETAAPTDAPAATPPPTAPPATGPPTTVAPTATPPPVVAAPTAPPPADAGPVRVVRVVRTELEDLPVEDLESRDGDNTISFGWDEAAGITSASSGTRFVRGGGSELFTDLSEEEGRISNRMTLRNTAEAARLRVRGRLVHEVYQGARLVARLRSDPIDVVLAPGGEVAARFSYLLPTGDYTVQAAFVSSQ
jgi:uncharacterized repeat protein (TIGR01451 family)